VKPSNPLWPDRVLPVTIEADYISSQAAKPWSFGCSIGLEKPGFFHGLFLTNIRKETFQTLKLIKLFSCPLLIHQGAL
jgi:hypothetical protein